MISFLMCVLLNLYFFFPCLPLALQPSSGLGRLNETFRFTEVSRYRTVGKIP
jgi:hypothetical protein